MPNRKKMKVEVLPVVDFSAESAFFFFFVGDATQVVHLLRPRNMWIPCARNQHAYWNSRNPRLASDMFSDASLGRILGDCRVQDLPTEPSTHFPDGSSTAGSWKTRRLFRTNGLLSRIKYRNRGIWCVRFVFMVTCNEWMKECIIKYIFPDFHASS